MNFILVYWSICIHLTSLGTKLKKIKYQIKENVKFKISKVKIITCCMVDYNFFFFWITITGAKPEQQM